MYDTAPSPALATARRNAPPRLTARGVNLWYGDTHALKDVDLDLYDHEILAFIGPSGCGKSTMLKCFNRMHEGTRGVRVTGDLLLDGQDIMDPALEAPMLRRRFGWVAQKPNPFPKSVYENVAYGARLHGIATDGAAMDAHVEHCLRLAMLWDEMKDDLNHCGTDLSGGQQQRLCIARALSTEPDFLLMDEPTGSIDPVATAAIEELILRLKAEKSVVIITHSMMQARRIADRVAYFHLGRMLELAPTERIFAAPETPEAQNFISGAVG